MKNNKYLAILKDNKNYLISILGSFIFLLKTAENLFYKIF